MLTSNHNFAFGGGWIDAISSTGGTVVATQCIVVELCALTAEL